MKKKALSLLLSLFAFASVMQAQAYLKLPALFDDGMVLQADDTVTIWGWSDPNTEVTIQTSWGETSVTKSDYSTLWKARLHTPKASFDPQSISITTKRKASRTINDVLLGQVWLCGGQSNMNWSAANGIRDAAQAIREPVPAVRLFTIPKKANKSPLDDVDGKWAPCDSVSARWFSAVGFFFGRKLASELGQPIGLVNASWGGTPVELWMRSQTLSNDVEMKSSWNRSRYSKRQGWLAGAAYNAMIYPIGNFGLSGIIWYQGEANRENAELYAREFTAMIEDWRRTFNEDLPVYFVQIAPKEYNGGDSKGALVREQQEYVAHTVSKTGIVNISDTVDDLTDIHPKYKAPVGERLANYALAEVYGRNAGKYKSPSYASMSVKKNRVVVSFNDADGGLVCKGGDIVGLEIGDGTAFYPAQGMIQGDRMVVWSKSVKKPVAVRYCFGLYVGNVFDKAGNPVLPFRSDNPLLSSDSNASGDASNTSAKAALIVSCNGAEIRPLTNGTFIFTNRKYTIASVPESIKGNKFVASEGGGTHKLEITAPGGGYVSILARNNKNTKPVLSDWTPDISSVVLYSTNDPSKPGKLIVWTRYFAKGETVTLSVNDFPGCMVLSPTTIELR